MLSFTYVCCQYKLNGDEDLGNTNCPLFINFKSTFWLPPIYFVQHCHYCLDYWKADWRVLEGGELWWIGTACHELVHPLCTLYTVIVSYTAHPTLVLQHDKVHFVQNVHSEYLRDPLNWFILATFCVQSHSTRIFYFSTHTRFQSRKRHYNHKWSVCLKSKPLWSIEPIDHRVYQPSSLLTIKPINHQAYQPSSLLTIKPINHWAYQPSSLSTIEPIDHQAYWPSSLSTIEPIDHQA